MKEMYTKTNSRMITIPGGSIIKHHRLNKIKGSILKGPLCQL